MHITPRRFVAVHTWAGAAALAVYLVGIFGIKVLQPAILVVLGTCCFNLLHLSYFSVRIRKAALMWLVPLAVCLLTWQRLIEAHAGGQTALHGLTALIICGVPLALLASGTSPAASPPRKRLTVIKIRIAVQCLIFLLYVTVTAFAWIRGSRVDLLFWGLFHVLTTALLPFLVGRALCGWICPNATIQDGLYRHLPISPPIPRLPRSIEAQSSSAAMSLSGTADKAAPYMPATLLLIWFLLFVIETVFDTTRIMAYSIFFMYGVIVLSFLLPWRKLCTHFCWIAGYKTLACQVSLWRIRYNRTRCRQCSSCAAEKVCPFFIDIRNQQDEMPATCCLCFECMEACPQEDVLTFRRIT